MYSFQYFIVTSADYQFTNIHIVQISVMVNPFLTLPVVGVLNIRYDETADVRLLNTNCVPAWDGYNCRG
jgi:hypothetical protein